MPVCHSKEYLCPPSSPAPAEPPADFTPIWGLYWMLPVAASYPLCPPPSLADVICQGLTLVPHIPLVFCPGFPDSGHLRVQPGSKGALIAQGANPNRWRMDPVGKCSSVFRGSPESWWDRVPVAHSGDPTQELTRESASLPPVCFSLPGSPLLFPWMTYQKRLSAFRGTQAKPVPKTNTLSPGRLLLCCSG